MGVLGFLFFIFLEAAEHVGHWCLYVVCFVLYLVDLWGWRLMMESGLRL